VRGRSLALGRAALQARRLVCVKVLASTILTLPLLTRVQRLYF
jgi:hypothetical protein